MMIGEAVAGAAGAAATPMGVVPVVLAALPVFSGQKKTSALYIFLLLSPPRGGSPHSSSSRPWFSYDLHLSGTVLVCRVNCPFYFKIGACRHGERCSRLHNKPTFSQTVLCSNMYQQPVHLMDPAGGLLPG